MILRRAKKHTQVKWKKARQPQGLFCLMLESVVVLYLLVLHLDATTCTTMHKQVLYNFLVPALRSNR